MSGMQEMVDYFGTLELFRGLDASQLEDLARMAQPFELRPGETLFRQGDASDGMYVIQTGLIEIRARVPGDETMMLARLGPGDLLGEIALLDRGVRTAHAVAVEKTTGYWLGRHRFEILRLDYNPAALSLMGRLIESASKTLRRSYLRISELLKAPAPHSRTTMNAQADFVKADCSGIPFGSLPFFSRLSAQELSDVLAAGRLVSAKRGTCLYRQGAAPLEVFMVLRGAVRTMLPCGSANFQIAAHAPGSIVGVLSALDGQAHETNCEACEDATLLALERGAMEALRSAQTPLSWGLSEHIHEELVRVLRRCTDHASRLKLEQQLQVSK